MALKSERLYLVFFSSSSLRLASFSLSVSPFENYYVSYLDCKTMDSYCMVIGIHLVPEITMLSFGR
jgi:hypothetical protein